MKRRMAYNIFRGVATMFCMVAMVGCTDDELVSNKGDQNKVQVVPSFSTQAQVEVQTRAGEEPEPTGERFGNYVEAETFPVETSMGLVFYKNTNPAPEKTTYKIPTEDNFTGLFTYKGQKNTPAPWNSSVSVDPDYTYTVLGHVPHNCAEAEYEFNPDADGYYTIKLSNVKPVNDADVSVIVGVGKNHYWKDLGTYEPNKEKDKDNNEVIVGAIPGQFQYTTVKEQTNVMCLLMAHLFAQTRFSIAIDPAYHKLRDIRIRKLILSLPDVAELNAEIKLNPKAAPSDASAAQTAQTSNPKLSAIPEGYPKWKLKKFAEFSNEDSLKNLIVRFGWAKKVEDLDGKSLDELKKLGKDSATIAVIYDQTKGAPALDIPTGFSKKDKDTQAYKDAYEDENGKGFLLKENSLETAVRGFFTPVMQANQPLTFKLTTIYDVFDKKGNKTRSLASATNTYTTSMKDDNGNPLPIEAGYSYKIDITVKPSYLYQLSDGDLDNPVFVQN